MKEHGLFWLAIVVGMLLVARVSWAQDPNEPQITINPHVLADFGAGLGADGDSKYLFSAMFYPDYKKDGGVGLIGIGDDTGDGNQGLILGPGVEFPVGPAYSAAVQTLLPDPWASAFINVIELVRPYARAGALLDKDVQDISPLLGTSLHIRPNSTVQIITRADWINPQGDEANAILPGGEGFLFSVGAGFAF